MAKRTRKPVTKTDAFPQAACNARGQAATFSEAAGNARGPEFSRLVEALTAKGGEAVTQSDLDTQGFDPAALAQSLPAARAAAARALAARGLSSRGLPL